MRKGLAAHAALAYEIIQFGSQNGLPPFMQAILLQQGSDYTPYLLPGDYPTEESFPGVTAITSQMSSLLQQQIFPALATISAGGPPPLAVSYGALTSMASQAVSLLGRLESLTTVPLVLDAEWGAVCDGLQALLLFPEVFST